MHRPPFHLVTVAILVLLFSSLAAATPIAEMETIDAMTKASLARPACTANDGCVNYAHRRCGDPFASASCVKGFCCAACRDKC